MTLFLYILDLFCCLLEIWRLIFEFDIDVVFFVLTSNFELCSDFEFRFFFLCVKFVLVNIQLLRCSSNFKFVLLFIFLVLETSCGVWPDRSSWDHFFLYFEMSIQFNLITFFFVSSFLYFCPLIRENFVIHLCNFVS